MTATLGLLLIVLHKGEIKRVGGYIVCSVPINERSRITVVFAKPQPSAQYYGTLSHSQDIV